jgi:molecular chaperone DnaJ
MFFRSQRAFRASSLLFSKKDYYSILGVPRSSSEQEIKKAYFSLAKKYHPDINKEPDAKERFSEISTAYETLGSPEKRKKYDTTGMTGDEQDQSKSSDFEKNDFNPFDIYSNFQNFQETFTEDFFKSRKQKANYKGEEISLVLELSFLESVKGVQKTLSFERRDLCSTCHGTKVKPGTSPSKCLNCGGRGVVLIQKGPLSLQTSCSKCKGTGTIIKSFCVPCKGTGLGYSQVSEMITIPAGVAEGQSLRITNKGHCSETGGPQGDLLLKIQVIPHKTFKRSGQDILSEVFISVTQAVLGGVLYVETLNGSSKITVDSGTNSGEQKKIVGFGVPYLPPNQNKRGDHFVTLRIQIPRSLSEKERKIFEQLALEDENPSPGGFFNKFKTFYK